MHLDAHAAPYSSSEDKENQPGSAILTNGVSQSERGVDNFVSSRLNSDR